MDTIIKQIKEITEDSYIQIHMYGNEIWFNIYEIEIPIIIDLKSKVVYVNCEESKSHLDSIMLHELSEICGLLNDNLDMIENLLKMN